MRNSVCHMQTIGRKPNERREMKHIARQFLFVLPGVQGFLLLRFSKAHKSAARVPSAGECLSLVPVSGLSRAAPPLSAVAHNTRLYVFLILLPSGCYAATSSQGRCWCLFGALALLAAAAAG